MPKGNDPSNKLCSVDLNTVCFSIFIILAGYMYSIGQSTVADVSFALAIYGAISTIAFNLVFTMKYFTNKLGNAVGSYNTLIKPISVQPVELEKH